MWQRIGKDINERTNLHATLLCAAVFVGVFAGLFGGLLGFAAPQTVSEDQSFVVQPYVQLGDHPTYSKTDAEEVLWISTNSSAKWTVERSQSEQGKWSDCGKVRSKPITCSQESKDFLFECDLKNLPVGKPFFYRVRQDGKIVFAANSMARCGADEPYTFAVFGDFGAGSPGQKKIAHQCYNSKPDFLVVPGDIVYNFGLYKEYLKNFFPVINAEKESPEGVPFMSHILTFGILGNHDIALTRDATKTDLTKFPDALAYYFLWREPLNGPTNPQAGNTPIGGAEEEQKRFKELAGANFPAMGNYSFDYGNSHWLVLDGNHYTKWDDPTWRKWVEEDLEKAKHATWRFVSFHQPGFSVDSQHYNEQRMRLLSNVFEKEHVDIVFAGHAHDYQRTFPIKFSPTLQNGLPTMNANGTVDGDLGLDKKFDGAKNTTPEGVIYIVTGGGGAKLYGEFHGQQTAPKMSFIDKFEGNVHSYSLCNIKGETFSMKQINGDGKIIDQFVVEKNHQSP